MSLVELPGDALDASAHVATLQLLNETALYLRRLPAHPLTHSMIEKIETHLDDPLQNARRIRAEARAAAQSHADLIQSGLSFFSFTHFAPSGEPALACRLAYPELRIESPAYAGALERGEDAAKVASEIARSVSSGVTVRMVRDVFDRNS